MSTFWRALKKWAAGWWEGGPHFRIGPASRPYLLRWYVLPRNPLLNVYLHKFVRDDDDRALHDHPWPSLSLLLRGRYVEVVGGRRVFAPSGLFLHDEVERVERRPGSVVFRSAYHRHRVELPRGRPAWTLFVTGAKVREWGFWCPQGFVPWHQFVAEDDYGNVGRGCGEAP